MKKKRESTKQVRLYSGQADRIQVVCRYLKEDPADLLEGAIDQLLDQHWDKAVKSEIERMKKLGKSRGE